MIKNTLITIFLLILSINTFAQSSDLKFQITSYKTYIHERYLDKWVESESYKPTNIPVTIHKGRFIIEGRTTKTYFLKAWPKDLHSFMTTPLEETKTMTYEADNGKGEYVILDITKYIESYCSDCYTIFIKFQNAKWECNMIRIN